MEKSLLYPVTSFITLISTTLLIIMFLNGIDIVSERFFFPTIMIGFILATILGFNIKNAKVKRMALWSVGTVVMLMFLAIMITVLLWTGGNP